MTYIYYYALINNLNVYLLCFVPEAERLIDLAVAIMACLYNIETKPHYMQSCWAFPCTVYISTCSLLYHFHFSDFTDTQVTKKLSAMDTG